ncbi:hypothetical protein M404DRAFT_920709 [Pisolithus tinctorius Marx 270]|uniref:Uncharacterized protein n=1 Tax=Pisolithus tinctorius Marx 270 TaxID=870435 RepID=A0A0C3IJ95_PISTI|nr:hypothetical protein M404DRAFT_920709 [Pisolithus tinctorius Marx 270]
MCPLQNIAASSSPAPRPPYYNRTSAARRLSDNRAKRVYRHFDNATVVTVLACKNMALFY